jgi:hypothetical protein
LKRSSNCASEVRIDSFSRMTRSVMVRLMAIEPPRLAGRHAHHVRLQGVARQEHQEAALELHGFVGEIHDRLEELVERPVEHQLLVGLEDDRQGGRRDAADHLGRRRVQPHRRGRHQGARADPQRRRRPLQHHRHVRQRAAGAQVVRRQVDGAGPHPHRDVGELDLALGVAVEHQRGRADPDPVARAQPGRLIDAAIVDEGAVPPAGTSSRNTSDAARSRRAAVTR